MIIGLNKLDWQQVLTALNNFDKSKIDEYLKQVYYDHYHNQYKNFLQAIIPGLAISKIKLKNETWDYLIKNLHLKDGKISSKTTYTIFNFNSSLNLSNEQINYLIKNSELSDISDIKEEDFFLKEIKLHNVLSTALRCNKDNNLNLTKSQWVYLFQNSNLNEYVPKKDCYHYHNYDDYPPLLTALRVNNKNNLLFDEEMWDFLIKNSDLKFVADDNMTALLSACHHIRVERIKMFDETWQYLIDNSDLSSCNYFNWNSLMLACNNDMKLNLIKKIVDKMNEQKVPLFPLKGKIRSEEYIKEKVNNLLQRINNNKNLEQEKKQLQETIDKKTLAITEVNKKIAKLRSSNQKSQNKKIK